MKSIKAITLILVCLLTACGGGGGGGGGESTAGNDSSGLRVLHGALDIPPLTVNTGESTYNASFRGDAPYRSLPGESASVVLHRANIPAAVLFERGVISDGETKQTLLVYGQEGDGSLQATMYEDQFPEIPGGMAAIRLAHGLHQTGAVSAVIGGEVVPGLSPGGLGEFVMVSAELLPYTVTEDGDPGPFISGSFEFEEKKYYTLFVTGEQGVFFTHRFYVDN